MATIDPNSPIHSPLGRPDGHSCPIKPNGNFGEILRESIDSSDFSTNESVKAESLNTVADIRPAHFTTTTLSSTDKVIDQVQQLINTMESYQQKLLEKEVTLQEIQPLIQKMATESESLSAISKTIPAKDSLRSIVNQSLILSSAEIVRFNSGFYNEG